MPLGFDEPFGVATVAFRHTVRVAPDKEVRISTWERHPVKALKSGSRPLAMPRRAARAWRTMAMTFEIRMTLRSV